MEKSNNEKLHKMLQEIYNNMNHWIAFAEAKNGALVALNIAVVAAISGLDVFKENTTVFCIAIVCCCISMIISLWSFYPKMGKNKAVENSLSESDNLLFYLDAAKHNKNTYLVALTNKYLGIHNPDYHFSEINKDYAQEITYNAKITCQKYKLFKIALLFDMVVFLIIIVMFVRR